MTTNHALRIKANGKLLLTGEYVVLDGAKALALPTLYGQRLEIEPLLDGETFLWISYDFEDNQWFSAVYTLHEKTILKTTDEVVAKRLQEIFKAIDQLTAVPFPAQACIIRSHLDFPNEWGLGTSSTLISLLSEASGTDPYALLSATFGGSGYDIACAQSDSPIVFSLKNKIPEWSKVNFQPAFAPFLYFVYLGKKQDSREGIKHYRNTVSKEEKESAIKQINALTEKLLEHELDIFSFQKYLAEHEAVIGKLINLTPVKERCFSDFNGAVKSLGAWGGDFVLAVSLDSEENIKKYFHEKGLDTIIPYHQMIK